MRMPSTPLLRTWTASTSGCLRPKSLDSLLLAYRAQSVVYSHWSILDHAQWSSAAPCGLSLSINLSSMALVDVHMLMQTSGQGVSFMLGTPGAHLGVYISEPQDAGHIVGKLHTLLCCAYKICTAKTPQTWPSDTPSG